MSVLIAVMEPPDLAFRRESGKYGNLAIWGQIRVLGKSPVLPPKKVFFFWRGIRRPQKPKSAYIDRLYRKKKSRRSEPIGAEK